MSIRRLESVLGLIAGFIASKIVNRAGGSLVLDLVLGIIGAVVGGFIFNQFGHSGVSGLNLYSLLVAISVRWLCCSSTTPSWVVGRSKPIR